MTIKKLIIELKKEGFEIYTYEDLKDDIDFLEEFEQFEKGMIYLTLPVMARGWFFSSIEKMHEALIINNIKVGFTNAYEVIA